MFRFKNEEEFIQEFDENFSNKVDWVPEMNFMFNTRVYNHELINYKTTLEDVWNKQVLVGIRRNYRSWTIRKDMLVRLDTNPYRKFIYKYYV